MSSIATYERAVLRDRIQLGIEEDKRQGKYKGRKKIPTPKNFEIYYEKYRKSYIETSYSLKSFMADTKLTRSVLVSRIREENIKRNKLKEITQQNNSITKDI